MNFCNGHAFCYGWIQGLFLLLSATLGFPYRDDAKDRQELTRGPLFSWLLREA